MGFCRFCSLCVKMFKDKGVWISLLAIRRKLLGSSLFSRISMCSWSNNSLMAVDWTTAKGWVGDTAPVTSSSMHKTRTEEDCFLLCRLTLTSLFIPWIWADSGEAVSGNFFLNFTFQGNCNLCCVDSAPTRVCCTLQQSAVLYLTAFLTTPIAEHRCLLTW